MQQFDGAVPTVQPIVVRASARVLASLRRSAGTPLGNLPREACNPMLSSKLRASAARSRRKRNEIPRSLVFAMSCLNFRRGQLRLFLGEELCYPLSRLGRAPELQQLLVMSNVEPHDVGIFSHGRTSHKGRERVHSSPRRSRCSQSAWPNIVTTDEPNLSCALS